MTETITAVYEKGVLRPLQPLNLREQQRVRIQVLPEETEDEGAAVIQILVEAGLMRPPDRDTPPPPDPVSEKERLDLAKRLSQAPGKPLSEIVIEDRGER
jgi:predicted DNA-binding antitoxin AbrB/MazE fold protein